MNKVKMNKIILKQIDFNLYNLIIEREKDTLLIDNIVFDSVIIDNLGEQLDSSLNPDSPVCYPSLMTGRIDFFKDLEIDEPFFTIVERSNNG